MLIKRPFEWWARLTKAEEPCDVYAGAPVYLTSEELEQRRADMREACERDKAVGDMGLTVLHHDDRLRSREPELTDPSPGHHAERARPTLGQTGA